VYLVLLGQVVLMVFPIQVILVMDGLMIQLAIFGSGI
jgi:hypothetical protein